MAHPPEHPTTGPEPEPAETPPPASHAEHDAMIRRHKRTVLTAAAVTIVVFMAYPVLTTFTGVFNGVSNGIGAGYAAGLVVVVLPLLGGVAYIRWTSRIEERGRR
ncbi:hypothetical protein GCM10022254_40650 [Actinomadura meridiana]|uniref:DUF485 domain-containing protein n=1 Tax=Actinomadura meridiana TaxID=559626 RepID=A0ABP8C707_9ACTN